MGVVLRFLDSLHRCIPSRIGRTQDGLQRPRAGCGYHLQAFGLPKHVTSGQEVTCHPLRLPRVREWEHIYLGDL